MLSIGLTGGIACGKSTVADILRARGIPVLNIDQVARDVVEPGHQALKEIQALWPEVVVDGRLNRKALGAKVIADPAVKHALEGITHPRIFELLDAWLMEQEAAGAPVVVVEDAVMVETGSYTAYDRLLVVTCKPETQRARLMAREGYTAEEASKWFALQLAVGFKERLAHAVIQNEGDPSALEGEVDQAWSTLLADP